MFFRQFHLPGLGHASYPVGSEETGEALVLDPQRRVDEYFEVPRTSGLRVTHALDSHGHNDYLVRPRRGGRPGRRPAARPGGGRARLGPPAAP